MLFRIYNKLILILSVTSISIIFSNTFIIANTNEMSILSNVSQIEQPDITNTSVSINSNQALNISDTAISNQQIINKEIKPDIRKRLLNNKISQSKNIIAVMGEFGMGNVISIYGAYDLGPLFLGTGIGYYFYDDDENETSISVFEPAILIMRQFNIKQYRNIILARIRAGIDLITEKRFGLSGETYCISPDVMLQLKGIYAGIGLPIIIGKEGTSIVFSIGAGYRYMFSF